MQIANPIYDVVFKYLLDDNKIAKKLLGLIIGEEILSLTLRPTECRAILPLRLEEEPDSPYGQPTNGNPIDPASLTVFHIDFAATIRQKNGITKQLIIELQKAKYAENLMRFRKYLGAQYADPNNTYQTEDGKTLPLPILSIYFLGHKLSQNVPHPIIHVRHGCFSDGKPIEVKDDFIQCLTHDGIIIQIPELKNRRQTELERVLSVFDERALHILQFDETGYPQEYREILRRLQCAMAEKELENTMQTEDNYLSILLARDQKIAQQHQELQEKELELQEKQLELQEKEKALEKEKAKALAEKETIIAKTIETLIKMGHSPEQAREVVTKNLPSFPLQ